MRELAFLRSTLRRIDGRSYRAYQDIRGGYATDDFELYVDHVQGDPFAAPSRLRVVVSHETTRMSARWLDSQTRRTALADLVVRRFSREARRIEQRRGSGKSGLIDVDRPGQQVLERTACTITESAAEVRFNVGLPARGRRVLGKEADGLLTEDVIDLIEEATYVESYRDEDIDRHLESVEDQRALRAALLERGLVAFIGDGAILPRMSGVDSRPMSADAAVPFESPASLAVELPTPNRGVVRGMGIPHGVTLIVGGGYHGKSTLLSAIELGIYDHVPGDGRELVVSDPGVVKIRAEDGRRVEGVDISPFINNLPGGRDTHHFTSDDASGSTSQAASVVEAIEAGATALLIDEDTAATNFMIRDRRMQQLIAKDREPITPFVDKVRQLADEREVSTVVVIGGSGDYFDVADRVVAMDAYRAEDVTAAAHRIAEQPTGRTVEGGEGFGQTLRRRPLARSVDPSKGRRDVKISVRDFRRIQFGDHDVDLTAISQFVDRSQLRAVGRALAYARKYMDGTRTVAEILDAVEQDLGRIGLDAVSSLRLGDLAAFRRFELAAALNRLRTLEIARS